MQPETPTGARNNGLVADAGTNSTTVCYGQERPEYEDPWSAPHGGENSQTPLGMGIPTDFDESMMMVDILDTTAWLDQGQAHCTTSLTC
jgi:hypothetical protein